MYVAGPADNERLLPCEREGLEAIIGVWLAQPKVVPLIIIGESPNRIMRGAGNYFPAFPNSESRIALEAALPPEAIERAYRINAVHYPYKPKSWSAENDQSKLKPAYDAKNGSKRMRILFDTIDDRLRNGKIIVLCFGKSGLETIRRGLDEPFQKFDDLVPYTFRRRFKCYQSSHPSPTHSGFDNQLLLKPASWALICKEIG